MTLEIWDSVPDWFIVNKENQCDAHSSLKEDGTYWWRESSLIGFIGLKERERPDEMHTLVARQLQQCIKLFRKRCFGLILGRQQKPHLE